MPPFFANRSKARILIALPFLTMGGGEAVVSQLCRYLKRRGFEIFVITTVPAMDCQGDTTDWFRSSTRAIYHLPGAVPRDRWPKFIGDLIARRRIDLLWLIGSSLVYELLPELKMRFPHLAVVDLLFNPVGHTADHLRFSGFIDHATVEHEGLKNWLMERGSKRDQVTVIPNGVDREQFSPCPRSDWRTGLIRPPDQPPFTVAFFGRFSEEKGPDIFVDLAARFKHRSDVEFLMCGAGIMEPALRQQIEKHGLAGRIHLLGFRNTAQVLPACDVVVVCSRADGRPNLVMESLSMGVPVIASRTGGIPELVPEGCGSVLVEPGDVDALERAVLGMIGSPESRSALADSAKKFAEHHFSSTHSGEVYEDLLLRIIRSRQNEPRIPQGPLGRLRAVFRALPSSLIR